MYSIGIDVGGTFTDVVLIDRPTGASTIAKVPSTPTNPVEGALNGIRKVLELAGASASDVEFLGHGTTIATNLLVEGKGAPTALVATRGFRDLLEIRRSSRHDRADLYDLHFQPPAPLVPRHLRLEASERVKADQTVLSPIEDAEIDRLVGEIRASGVKAVAVCFINAHLNGENEARLVSELRARLPDVFVSASHEVNPEILEYERTSTTVINSMLGPKCSDYIREFRANVSGQGISAPVLFMQSSGGLTPPEFIAERPIVLMESGPAGGVTAAAKLCRQLGVQNAILGDVGGTTYDVSLIRDGEPERKNSCSVHSYVIRAPTIDIESVGAGGGSIAWVDEAGGLHIGPQSAGASPGPACYSRGGKLPTVTDCNFLLGYLDIESFSREIKVDLDLARAALQPVADELGLDLMATAEAVRALTVSHMAQAMRLLTVERGHDPREFAFICFGGSGPVHARDVARELDMPVIIVPPFPGLFSPTGMLVADEAQEAQAPVMAAVDVLDDAHILQEFARLEGEAAARFLSKDNKIQFRRRVDCRYVNQSEAISVELPADLKGDLRTALRAAFEAEHKRQWNFVRSELPIIALSLRVFAVAETGIHPIVKGSASPTPPAPYRERKIYRGGAWHVMPTYLRADLRIGDVLNGPCILEEDSSSMALAEGDTCELRENGALWITVKVEE